MRFMIIVRATPDSEAGKMPDDSLLASMATYHEALVKAGVLLDANGLHPTSKGWRVRYDGSGERKLLDGPFAETKEVLLGFYTAEFDSLDEAVAFSKELSAVNPGSSSYEIRPFYVFHPGEIKKAEGGSS